MKAHLLAAQEAGGSAFEIFSDQGIPSIAVYGEGDVLNLLAECAGFSEVAVERWLSDRLGRMTIHMPATHLVYIEDTVMASAKLPAILIACKTVPPEQMKKIRALSDNVVWLYEALNYSLEKHTLQKELCELRHRFPGIPVIVACLPQLGLVKNRSAIEDYIQKNFKPGDFDRQETWHQNVIDAVFREHGLPKDYIQEAVAAFRMFQREKDPGRCMDVKGRYVNCIGGNRVTTDLPDRAERTIFFFGNSVVVGIGAGDEHTIPSQLQQMLNERGDNHYLVQNYGNMAGKDYPSLVRRIRECPLGPGDIVIVGIHSHPSYFEQLYKDFHPCNLQPYFDRPHNLGEVFYDNVHMNFLGYRTVARKLFQVLCGDIFNRAPEHPEAQVAKAVRNQSAPLAPALQQELEQYLEELKQWRRPEQESTGAVVMNCNPFTLGHRYLVEQASASVGHLFVFVVEEDKSFFSFADRISLVRAGTEDLENVTVLPSGKFQVSTLTFELYFQKERYQKQEVDTSVDVEMFGRYIAPALGIEKRFLGEEPFDAVTRQYNASLQKILPGFGVAVQVIPRKEIGGTAVSASLVRRLLEKQDFESIAGLVPETTLRHLQERYK